MDNKLFDFLQSWIILDKTPLVFFPMNATQTPMKTTLTTLCSAALLAVCSPQTDAAIIQLDLSGTGGAGLLTTNENPDASGTGSGGEVLGGIFINDVTNQITIDVAWGSVNGFTDLTGDATGMHIHGPTTDPAPDGFEQNAGVMVGLNGLAGFDADASSGGFSGTVDLTDSQVATILNEQTYLNVHTAANGGGEIRGQLIIPEPGSAVLISLAGGLLILRRRR